MSIESKLKTIFTIAFGVICFNQEMGAVTNFIVPNLFQRNNFSLEEAKSQKYVIGKDYTEMELFCIAYSSKKYFKTKEDSLRDSNCSDKAKSIKEMYNFFAEKAGKPELTDKLRVVEGMIIDINDRRWHYWLELEDSDGGKLYFDPSSKYSFPDFSIVETNYANAISEKQLTEEDYLNDIFEEDSLNDSFEKYAELNDIPDASTTGYPEIDSFDKFPEYNDLPELKPTDKDAIYENLAEKQKVRCGTAQIKVRMNDAMEFTLAREWKGIMVPTAEGLLYPGGLLGLAYELLSDFNGYMRDLNPKLEKILPFLPKEKIDKIEKTLPWKRENKLINIEKVLKDINIISVSEKPKPFEKYSDFSFFPEEKTVKD